MESVILSFSTIILAVDNEEEENVEPALEPKWKFDRITSITIDEPIATWFHINKYFNIKMLEILAKIDIKVYWI